MPWMYLHWFLPVLEWFSPVLDGFLLGLLALTLHELGHALAATIVGVRVKGIGLDWKGLYLRREAGTPRKNLVISAAGPVTNILLVILWAWWPMFGLANACYALFNLLPLPGADGERAVRCWLEMTAPKEQARPVVRDEGKADETQRRAG
jgi:Zn-dependent protease